MAVLDASRPTAEDQDHGDDRGLSHGFFEPEPTPLELAHLLAELNFLRAQLTVLRSELNPPSEDANRDDLFESDLYD